jgi:hypothetical protein
MDFGLAQIVAIATLLLVLGGSAGSAGPKIGYDGVQPPPQPPSSSASTTLK